MAGIPRPPKKGEKLLDWWRRCRPQIRGCGDSLFAFIVAELCEGAENGADAGSVLDRAIADIECVKDAVEEATDKSEVTT